MKRALPAVILAILMMAVLAGQEHAPAAEAGGHAPAEAEHGPNLDLWKWVNFAILAGVLGWGIGKAAPAFFRSRTEEIQKGIADASRMRQEAEARAAKMEMRMASLQSEIEHLRSEARAEMAHDGERIRKETAALISRIQAHGEQEIEALTKHAEQHLKEYSAGLALTLAEQRIRGRMSSEAQNRLVEGFIYQVGRGDAGGGPKAPGVRP